MAAATWIVNEKKVLTSPHQMQVLVPSGGVGERSLATECLHGMNITPIYHWPRKM